MIIFLFSISSTVITTTLMVPSINQIIHDSLKIFILGCFNFVSNNFKFITFILDALTERKFNKYTFCSLTRVSVNDNIKGTKYLTYKQTVMQL